MQFRLLVWWILAFGFLAKDKGKDKAQRKAKDKAKGKAKDKAKDKAKGKVKDTAKEKVDDTAKNKRQRLTLGSTLATLIKDPRPQFQAKPSKIPHALGMS